MSETKAKLAVQVEQLKAKVTVLLDVAQAAQNLLEDMQDGQYAYDETTARLMGDLQVALQELAR